MKFGKQPARHDDRTLQFARYLTAALPTPPQALDYSGHVKQWPMYGNDAIGDCTCAAAGHMVELWTAMKSAKSTPSVLAKSTITRMYGAVTGWPAAGDNGANELDILNYWRKTGLTKTHKLHAFAQIQPLRHDHVMSALQLFGGVYIGFGISDANQLFREFNAGQPWTPEAGQITEGHAVNIVGYDAQGLTCVTWGRLQRMTWGFWDNQVDEAWCILPSEWASSTKPGPTGFSLAQLDADLGALGQVH